MEWDIVEESKMKNHSRMEQETETNGMGIREEWNGIQYKKESKMESTGQRGMNWESQE